MCKLTTEIILEILNERSTMLKSIYDIPKQSWYNALLVHIDPNYSNEEKLLYVVALLCVRSAEHKKAILLLPDWNLYASCTILDNISDECRTILLKKAVEDYKQFNMETIIPNLSGK